MLPNEQQATPESKHKHHLNLIQLHHKLVEVQLHTDEKMFC